MIAQIPFAQVELSLPFQLLHQFNIMPDLYGTNSVIVMLQIGILASFQKKIVQILNAQEELSLLSQPLLLLQKLISLNKFGGHAVIVAKLLGLHFTKL